MTKRALVIGSQVGLLGVETDAKEVRKLLRAHRFEVELRIRDRASRDGILEGYQRLIAATEPGDAAVVYYSGHGHTAIDQDRGGDRGTDRGGAHSDASPRRFQGIVPTDFQQSTSEDYRGITSWELSILLARLTRKSKNATVILDCCHSAQMSRDGAAHHAVPRALPHPLRVGFRPHLEALRARYPGELEQLSLHGNPDAVRLVACGQLECAFEYLTDAGVYRGAFTEALTKILREATGATLSWAALGRAIREHVLRRFPSQRPELEGPVQRHVFALTEEDGRGSAPLIATTNGFQLRAGRLCGVSVGDTYDVFALGAAWTPAQQLAVVTVDEVAASVAEVRVSEWQHGHRELAEQTVAVPRARSGARRAVAVLAPDPERAMIERAIAATPTLCVAARHQRGAAPPEIATVRLSAATLTIEDAAGPLFPGVAFPRHLDDTVKHLANLGVAQALRELEGEHGISELRELSIELGAVVDGRLCRLADRGAALGLGDRAYVRVVNRSPRDLYVHIFNVGVRGKITLLTDFAASGVLLSRQQEYVLGQHDIDGTLPGIPITWPAGLPRSTFPRLDEVIVIATTAAVGLQALETQEYVKRIGPRAPATPLQQLLAQLQDGQLRELGRATTGEDFLVKRLSYLLYPRAGRMAGLDFAVDDNPQLCASSGAASAWLEAPRATAAGAAIGAALGAAIDVRLVELTVEAPSALLGGELRLDTLVCTRAARGAASHRVTTHRFAEVRAGQRLLLAPAGLFEGTVHDFVDIYLWVSRDANGGAALADLLGKRALDDDVREAGSALALDDSPHAPPWVAAVGASLVLARAAFELLRGVTGKTLGLHRTSFLAHEAYGLGRHPRTEVHRAHGLGFALSIGPGHPRASPSAAL